MQQMISVIVPVYKVEPYLRKCVDSILGQIYRNIEVLLIDDGSPDSCGEICDDYEKQDERVRVFHTENCGLSAARNLGVSKAKGEYIGFVDSDDWIEPNMYGMLLMKMQETGSDIGMCSLWYEYEKSKKELKLREAIYSSADALRLLIDERISNHTWNKLYKTELLQRISFPEGVFFEDIIIMHRLLEMCNQVVTTQEFGYHYRQRKDGICNTHTAKNLIDYTDAHFYRYYYLQEHNNMLFVEKKKVLLKYIAEAMSRLLKWWDGCSPEEKEMYSEQLDEYKEFARTAIPILRENTWSPSVRLSMAFMHYLNNFSASAYYRISKVRDFITYKRQAGYKL